ncbi:hypothetical protein EB796_020269 [Bugula neritina]|uniref:Uncharacterized protein n=1 Tax=Bugula neritina TaxID=10212 RepID=A0A7J7J6Y6_BUGNE|nr:hypothetical protein EB796_020269 [Bugula neritina]
MSLPAYYYAKPRTDYITVTDTEARKAAGSWSFVPATLYEWVCVGMGCLTAASSVPKYGLPKPLYKSSWKLLPAYAASLWFARWSDRVTVRGYKYEDKVVDDYMRLYPEKFPEYGKLV